MRERMIRADLTTDPHERLSESLGPLGFRARSGRLVRRGLLVTESVQAGPGSVMYRFEPKRLVYGATIALMLAGWLTATGWVAPTLIQAFGLPGSVAIFAYPMVGLVTYALTTWLYAAVVDRGFVRERRALDRLAKALDITD